MIGPCILIVEDEAIIATEMKLKLKLRGYDSVMIASSGEKALQYVETHTLDLILMDIILKGDMDGVETVSKIKQKVNIPVIYLTGNSHLKTEKRLLETEPFGILTKPAHDSLLFDLIEKAIISRQ